MGGPIHLAVLALPLALAAAGAEAACQWTHRAGMPYIACDAGPKRLRPPEALSRETVPAPDVRPAPLPETPPQPPIAGTPSAPPGAASEWPDLNSAPWSAIARPEMAAPGLNRRPPPGLVDPPGGSSGAGRPPSLAR